MLLGFLLGATFVVAVEALLLYLLLLRLSRKSPESQPETCPDRDLGLEQQALTYPVEKQGVIWILEEEVLSNGSQSDLLVKGLKEQRNEQDKIEVSPVRSSAKIKGHSLVLIDQNGFETTIELLDCIVEAVSSSTSSSKKWMKKYPIRVESKNNIIFNSSRICYLFLETSWEKESWCKALRLASCSNRESLNWYTQLTNDFSNYLASLSAEYPLFLKPSVMPSEAAGKSIKVDENSTTVRGFLKKFAKKASKLGTEYRNSAISSSSLGDGKSSYKNLQDTLLGKSARKSSLEKISSQDFTLPTSPTSSPMESQDDSIPAAVWDEKLDFDEGTLCWNLLFSRLFFDAKRSSDINMLFKARIQKTLSSMRTPSFIGAITCTGLDLGNLPPYLHSMKALPVDMNEAWAVEVDIEYSSGLVLDIETRLEVREPGLQKGAVGASLPQNSTLGVPSDLLEDFQDSDQLDGSTNLGVGFDRKSGEEKSDDLRQSSAANWASTYMSRWKTILNSVADQVSQVPISFAIRVASLRGTLRLHIKPPPSDQLWVAFTSMPEIDFKFDSSIGDHKIAISHAALLINNRFKAAIRESLVLPNCEGIYIPWMTAEKNDWVPRSAAPFLWTCQGSRKVEEKDALKLEAVEPRVKSDTVKISKTRTASLDASKLEAVEPRVRSDTVEISKTGPASMDASKLEAAEPKVRSDTVKISKTSPASMAEQRDGEPKRSGPLAEPTLEHVGQIVSSDSRQEEPSISFLPNHSSHNSTDEDFKVPLLKSKSIEAPEIYNQSQVESPKKPLMPTLSAYELSSKSFDGEAKTKKGRKERMWDLRKKVSEKFDEKKRHIEEKGRNIVERMRENAKSMSEDDTHGSFRF